MFIILYLQYQKLGQNVFINSPEDIKCPDMNTSRGYCTCGRGYCTCGETAEVEPQTPSLLLPNEELDTFCQDKETKTRKTTSQLFLNTHFKARRHFSTPITPTFRPEGVV